MKQFALNKGPENGKNTQVLLFKICTLKKKMQNLGPHSRPESESAV